MYLVGSKIHLTGAAIVWDEKWYPSKGSHTISVEGGNDPQRWLWTLVHMYFVGVEFHGL